MSHPTFVDISAITTLLLLFFIHYRTTSIVTMAVKQRSGIAVGLKKGHVCLFPVLSVSP